MKSKIRQEKTNKNTYYIIKNIYILFKEWYFAYSEFLKSKKKIDEFS